MPKRHTGQCACGAIKFEFDTDPTFIASCHCMDCKKASGGEMATFFGVPGNDFTLLGGTPKSFLYVADSGKKLKRNFCPDCGARLFTRELESFPGLVFVTLGSLDRPEDIVPRVEIHEAPAGLGTADGHSAVPRHATLTEASPDDGQGKSPSLVTS